MKTYIYLLVLTLFFSSCLNDDLEALKDFNIQNENEIEEYLTKNKLTAKKTLSGLYYIIKNPGEGNAPKNDSNITVYYKGYFLNGEIFDESTTQKGSTFDLNALIPGFKEGIALLKVGGEATLIIPSDLAYGNTGSGNIPPGAVIVFDIRLISINN